MKKISQSTKASKISPGKRSYQKLYNKSAEAFESNYSDNQQNGRWSKVEHERFVECLKKFGKNWKLIEQELGSRNGSQIRSHAQKYFQKLEKFKKDQSKHCFDIVAQQKNSFNQKQEKEIIQEEQFLEEEIISNNSTKDYNYNEASFSLQLNNDLLQQQISSSNDQIEIQQQNELTNEEIFQNHSTTKFSFFHDNFLPLILKQTLNTKLTDFVNINPITSDTLIFESSQHSGAPYKKIQKKSFKLYCDEQNFSITDKQIESLRKLSGDDFFFKKL